MRRRTDIKLGWGMKRMQNRSMRGTTAIASLAQIAQLIERPSSKETNLGSNPGQGDMGPAVGAETEIVINKLGRG